MFLLLFYSTDILILFGLNFIEICPQQYQFGSNALLLMFVLFCFQFWGARRSKENLGANKKSPLKKAKWYLFSVCCLNDWYREFAIYKLMQIIYLPVELSKALWVFLLFELFFSNFFLFYHHRCKDTFWWSSCKVTYVRIGRIRECWPKHIDAGTINRNGETSSSKTFPSPRTTYSRPSSGHLANNKNHIDLIRLFFQISLGLSP